MGSLSSTMWNKQQAPLTPASLPRKHNCSPPVLIKIRSIIHFKRWIADFARKQRANAHHHHHLKWMQRKKKKGMQGSNLPVTAFAEWSALSCWAKPWPKAAATRAVRHGRLSSKGQDVYATPGAHFVIPWNAVTSHMALPSSENSHCCETNTVSWWWEMQWSSLKMRVQHRGGSDRARSIQLVGMVTERWWVLLLQHWGVSSWLENCSYGRGWVQLHWWCMVQQIYLLQCSEKVDPLLQPQKNSLQGSL